ncbi:Oligo-beta-mannoside permease IIC component [Paraliobacillus sp. PM-2]|uniref:PTS sugar transporter subunit IIC n=1 Tax=Paraliobacillus sp. PM-2 TaxID=1462524 RepID=UPI00061C2F36|nr:PTS transporter subunit EIIC [Paraliobacillus sp. PM-2]CQR45919.1 Oligo-beta-mannoside permease IIC component [Paraliobacillus sp. PM-2]
MVVEETNSKFQKALQKFLVPVAKKLENQVHIQAIKEGMMSIVPLIIIGSFSLLSLALLNMLSEGNIIHSFILENLNYFMLASDFTMGIISIYSAFFIAQSLASKYELNSIEVGITSVIVQFILCAKVVENGINTSNLDAQGIFVSIIVALLVVEITRFMNTKSLVIKLPKEVPSIVGKSFNNLLPMVISVVLFTLVSALSFEIAGKSFPELIMGILAPAIQSIDNVYAVVIILLLTQLLWFFGLHGAAITSSVWLPIATTYMATNATNIASGLEPTHVFTMGFYYGILQVTGSGLTLGLVVFMMRSKSKTLNPIGKASIIPSLFGINEPVIFGAPIVLNPFLFIPFVFGPPIIGGINYFMFSSGIIGKPIVEPPGFLPPGVGAFIMTLDWKAIIAVIVSLIVMTLIYYPFFKAFEKDELRKEERQEDTLSDESFNF